jgi:hypothetical protein
MRNHALKGILLAGLALPLATVSPAGSAEKIPDFSGGWNRIGDMVETFEPVPGATGAGPITIDPKHPRVQGGTGDQVKWVADLSNPILKPETRAYMQPIVENEIKGIPHLKDEGMCLPSGVPMLLNRRGGGPIQMLQTADQITVLNARDQQVRRIYLNVPHSKNPKPSWNGESVGHYEGGDTLVVDTIGQNDKTQIDRFGTPHSDQLHVIERYKVSADGRNLDVLITVEDPGAFAMPWTARARFAKARGPAEWDEQICAENNRFVGVITIRGKVTEIVPIPVDDTPDF